MAPRRNLRWLRLGMAAAGLPLVFALKTGSATAPRKDGPSDAPGRYVIRSADGTVRIPFDLHRGKIRMAAKVNGRDCRLSIDNGALWDPILFFGSPATDALGFRFEGDTAIGETSDPRAVRADVAPGVTVGFRDVEFLDQTAVVTRYVPGRPNVWEGIDGQVSATFFKSFIVKIDFDGSAIELLRPAVFTPPAGAEALAMAPGPHDSRTVRGVVEMPGGVKTEVDLLVDLGGIHPLYLPLGRYPGIRLPSNAVEASLGSGLMSASGYLGRVRSLTLGRHVLEGVVTAFTPVAPDASVFGNTMIGLPLLKRFSVYFDYPGGRLLLEPARSFAEPFKADMTGMEIVPDASGAARVSKVAPRSPAAEAGVQAGDLITRLDGKPVAEHAPGEMRAILSEEGREVRLDVVRDGKPLAAIVLRLRQIF